MHGIAFSLNVYKALIKLNKTYPSPTFLYSKVVMKVKRGCKCLNTCNRWHKERMSFPMLTPNVTPSTAANPLSQPRCNQELPQSGNLANCDAIICGALADVMTETGPRCNACLSEFGGEILTAVNHLWIKANVAAARELDQRFKLAQIGNGLFVRVGKRVR